MATVLHEATVAAGQTVEELELNVIAPAADNPRRELGDLAKLVSSMGELGLLQPLVVTPRTGKFMVVCGHRRYAAAKKAKLKTVPAIVRELDEPQRIKAMLVENCQRTDLAPLEEAHAYQLLVELGLSQRRIAGDVGKTQSHISKRLALLELPEKVQAKVDSGGISLADALELAKLKEHPKRLEHAVARASASYAPPLSHFVRVELEAVKLEQKVAAARARAEKKGWRIVESARDGVYWFTPPKGVYKIGQHWDELPLVEKTHEKEPCHAVGIEHKTGELVPLCTDRSRHPKLETHDEVDRRLSNHHASVEKQKRLEQRKQLDEARKLRHDYIQRLLKKKTPLPRLTMLELVTSSLIDGLDGYDYGQRACQWLGVLPPVDLSETTVACAGDLHVVVHEDEDKAGATIITAACGFRGIGQAIRRPGERDTEPDPADLCSSCWDDVAAADYGDYAETLRNMLVGANEQTLARIAVAAALAWHESGDWRGDPDPGYLRFLEATGHTLTQAERQHMAEEGAR